jgi:hypothetical protein
VSRLWIALATVGLVVLGGRDSGAHKLPNFPQVRLLSADPGSVDPLLRWLTVEVRDPAGRQPVLGAEVRVRARHATLGSGLRVDTIQFAPAAAPGTYQGEIRFPRAGLWALTIEVLGRYVGDAHIELEVAAPATAERGLRLDRPELPFDLLTLRHLAMEWGHLAGFALWLLATSLGLLDPTRRRRFVLIGTWTAFVIEGATGLYKMEYGTPFARGLQLFNLGQIPRVFFADDYARTLFAKHVLMVMAMAVTLILTLHAWRTRPETGVHMWRVVGAGSHGWRLSRLPGSVLRLREAHRERPPGDPRADRYSGH